VGRIHKVDMPGYALTYNVAGFANLGTSGGTFAQALYVPAPLYLDTLRYRNGDTATARSIEFGLFRDDGTANAVCIAKGTDSFTPGGAASNRSASFTSAPITVPPGAYWLVVRNTGGATNFLFSIASAGATNLGAVYLQTQTLGSALPAVAGTLDMTTGWTRTSNNGLACILLGRVFGEGSAF
jgi:hypothetical protein